MKLLLKSFC